MRIPAFIALLLLACAAQAQPWPSKPVRVVIPWPPGQATDIATRFVGQRLQIGNKVVLAVTDRDPRCKMITLDPETGASSPTFLRPVAQAHGGMAGVYGAVLVEGMVRKGDAVELLD